MVQRYATQRGVAPDRVQHGIAFMVLAGALDRYRTAENEPIFSIKSGLAVELRVGGDRARATRDFDAIVRRHLDDVMDAVDQALATPYGPFTFRRAGEARSMGPFLQFHVSVEFAGKSFSKVKVELSRPEGYAVEIDRVQAISLADFRLEGPDTVSCLALRFQIAQKIHAVSKVPPEGVRANDRFRDLLDLLLLREM